MDWLSLGHATWLCEAAGLRLLFDPLLAVRHHGDVFEVLPRRTLVAEALRPDFILVSHRHPDHFDVPSLRRLLALDPEAVVVTPDPLVAWAAERLGARTVKTVPAGQRLDLDGVTVITTPSLAPDEWGAVVATRDGAAWNQVDTVLADAAEVRRVADRCTAALAVDRLALALVRWQPMLEIAAQLGHAAAFPYADYAELLAAAAGLGAAAVVPSAAGAAHAPPWTAMNRRVFPVPEPRWLRDLATLGVPALPCRLGARYRVRDHAVELTENVATDLFTAIPGDDPRRFDPLELPPVHDPGLPAIPRARIVADLDAWVRGPLAAGLARACAGHPPLRFVLELRHPDTADVYTLHITDQSVHITRTATDDYDFLNIAAASLVWRVLTADCNWGDILLAGALRGCTRAYTLSTGRLKTIKNIGDLFVYHGLSYDDSVVRAVRRAVAAQP